MAPTIQDFGPDYSRQIENERRSLRALYGVDFEPVFDPSLGTFVLISSNRTIQQAFYPTDVSPIVYPAYSPTSAPPQIPTSAAPGYGVLRVEHIGLPQGYYPSTIIDGQFGSDAPIENFDTVAPELLAQYPPNVIEGINNGFRHIPNNRTQGRGLPYVVYPNAQTVQLELPMGGPVQFGYKITTQQTVSTPNGDYTYSSPWEGTSGGGQGLVNPQPGFLHVVRIRWVRADRVQNVPTTPPVTTTPKPLPTPPSVPPAVQQEIRRVQIVQSDGLRPQFLPSTMPQQPAAGPLPNPYVRLVRPFQDPANTFRARSVTEMYSFSPNAGGYEWIYEVGRPPTIAPLQYKFRNNTVNSVLRFQFELPEWAETDSPKLIDMDPQTEMMVTVRFKESDAKMKSTMNSRRFSQQLRWYVTPLDVRGPVYVLRNLPPLVTVNPSPKQDPQLNSPQPPVVLQVGGNSELVLDPNARIYAQINPPRASMVVGERMPIQFAIWAGPPGVTPDQTNSKQLLFPVNGVIWKSLNENVAVIDSPNGSVNATLVAINPGIIEISAEIVAPPANVSLVAWQNAYNNGVAGVNVRARRTVNNFEGILAGGSVRVVTSRSQLR